MDQHRRGVRRQRGITLVELLVVITIIGLILTLLGLEFVSVVNSTLHSRANTDAESQARLIMSKIETHLRNAYFDYSDFTGSPVPVISPAPASSAGYVLFYRTQPGQLTAGAPFCKAPANGAPCPVFETVLIQMNPANAGELDEIVTPQPAGTPEPVTVLGTNVTGFAVTAQAVDRVDIALTVSEPSGHCVNSACSFTLNDIVYVGGTQ